MMKQLAIQIQESNQEQSGKIFQKIGHVLSVAQARKNSQKLNLAFTISTIKSSRVLSYLKVGGDSSLIFTFSSFLQKYNIKDLFITQDIIKVGFYPYFQFIRRKNMKKRMFSLVLIALAAISFLTAAGTSEEAKLINLAESVYISYKPESRVAEMEKYGLDDELLEASNAAAFYNWGRTAERVTTGDDRIFNLLDKIYDGILYSPLLDLSSLDSVSYQYLGDISYDGKAASVFDVDASVNEAELFYQTLFPTEVIDIDYEIAIDKNTGRVLYQIGSFERDGYDIIQTAYFENGLPTTIVTEAYRDRIPSMPLIHEIDNIMITESIAY